MPSSQSNSERFRSASDFPRTLQGLDPTTSEKLYLEMRDCLIFTNRSRAQLIRHNNGYRDKVAQLKVDVVKLQTSISTLSLEKRDLVQSNQAVIAALQQEMGTLTQHLDQLSIAFDDVAQLDTLGQTQMSVLAFPQRFFRFLQAVRNIVLWWRAETETPSLPPTEKPLTPEDLSQNPQLGTDPAAVGRSLLDR